jgi:hypothetical protein
MILSRFFNDKKTETKFYLGIILKQKGGVVWILEKKETVLTLKIKKKFFYSNGFENIIEDIDYVLTAIEQEKVSVVKDIKKTIFCLSSFFVDEEGKIKKIYLAKLKELVKKLELEALGYLEISAAIIEQLEKKEGLLLSFIFLEINQTSFRFIVRKTGKTIFERDFVKTDNFLLDFYEALSKVKDYSPLPIRIIIWDEEELNQERNILTNHSFKEDYFIQPPRIETFYEQDIEKIMVDSLNQHLVFNYPVDQEKNEVTEKKEVMGFLIGEDIQLIKDEKKIPQNKNLEKKLSDFQLKNLFYQFLFVFNQFKLVGNKLLSILFIKKIKIPSLIALVIFLICGSFIIDEYFFHKAQITLYLPVKRVEDQIKIETSFNNLKQIKTVLKTEAAIKASGEKTTGEKARGEVNLYNYTFLEKDFNAGTSLEANGLKFVLESDVKVASASQIGEMRQPGKSKASVLATFIGEEGNLKKGTIFKIDDLSIDNFFAKNDNDFSGGSHRKIKFFDLEDKEKLDKITIQSIEKKADLYLSDKKNNNFFIEPLKVIEIKNKSYSKEVGEEADTVSEKAEANISYYFLPKNDLEKKLTSILKAKLPNGYYLSQEKVRYQLVKVEKDTTKINLIFNCVGDGIKKIDRMKIAKDLAFANENDLKKILQERYQINKINYENKKKIPLFKSRLPIFVKNIKLLERSL